MSYTQADLEAVRRAKLKLALGQMLVEVTIDGETNKFAPTDMEKLNQVEQLITAELDDGSEVTSFYLTSAKGL